MQQKIKFMRLLVIGILSSLASCNIQIDGRYIREYYLINETGLDIQIKTFIGDGDELYVTDFSLPKDSVFFQSADIFMGNRDGILAEADSLSIRFGDMYDAQFSLADTVSKFNLLNSNNYEIERIKDNYEKLTYTFTEADVNNAMEN